MEEHAADEVSLFMEKLGFYEDAEILRRENISMRILKKMTNDDLTKIGITFGHSFEIREALEIPMQYENKELDIGTDIIADERLIELERSSDVVSDEDSDDSPPSPPSSAREKVKQYKKRDSGQFRLSDVDKDHLQVSYEETNEPSPFLVQEQSKSVYNLDDREVQISYSKNESPSALVRGKIKPIPRSRKNPPKKRNSSDIQISEENTAISQYSSVREEMKPLKSLDGGDISVPGVNTDKSQYQKISLFYTRDTQQGSERDGHLSLPSSVPEKNELLQEREKKKMQISDEPPRPSVREKVRPMKNRDGCQSQISDENMDVSTSFSVEDKRKSLIQVSNENSTVDPNYSIQEDINLLNKRDDSQSQDPEKAQDVSTNSVRNKIKSFDNPETSQFQVPPTQHTEGDQKTNLRVILVGKTGTGKSTTANTILGGRPFSTSSSGSSITKQCSSECANRFGRKIQVIDTPGLFDTMLSQKETEEEILKCIALSAPGPHVFILVLNVSRFTKEEEETAMRFFDLFKNAVFEYFIVLFTRLDDLEYERKSLAEHLQSIPQNLKSILQKCQGRYIAFNNRASDEEKDRQVRQLLEIIDENLSGRNMKYYTDEMFQEAERMLRDKAEEIKRASEYERGQKYELLRKEVERKYEEKQMNLKSRLAKISESYRTTENHIALKKEEIGVFVRTMENKKKMIEIEAKEIERKKNEELKDLTLERNEQTTLIDNVFYRNKIVQSIISGKTKASSLFKSAKSSLLSYFHNKH